MPAVVNRLRSPKWLSVFLLPIMLATLCYYTLSQISTSPPLRNRNIVLLIAHPDDEAMFFSPTIQSLTSPPLSNTVQIICFSIGDAEGIGSIRQSELLTSASLLGLENVNTTVIVHDHPALPDSMSRVWPEDLVASLMSGSVGEFERKNGGKKVDTLVTFDKGGISGHSNHISLLAAARYYIKNYPREGEVLLYTLTTVPIYRKYISIVDAFVTALLRRKDETVDPEYAGTGAPKSVIYLSGWKEYRTAQKAMTEGHKSQMIWFRWGWITLSRYMVFNDLVLDTNAS
ncbi:hypothetical protein ABW19_dt0207856 [Dactylella cylindrospora]|nr:hypothetical protein ABW19_dt0207856 [Dactylella cylindrospora]